MDFCKQIPGRTNCRDKNWFPHVIVGWNLPRLDGLKFQPGKTGSYNHYLRQPEKVL